MVGWQGEAAAPSPGMKFKNNRGDHTDLKKKLVFFRVERYRDPGRFPGPGFAGIGKAGIGTGITGIKYDRDRDRDFPVSIIGTGIIPESRFFGPGLGFFLHFFRIRSYVCFPNASTIL